MIYSAMTPYQSLDAQNLVKICTQMALHEYDFLSYTFFGYLIWCID